jgi:hypothetical protein
LVGSWKIKALTVCFDDVDGDQGIEVPSSEGVSEVEGLVSVVDVGIVLEC